MDTTAFVPSVSSGTAPLVSDNSIVGATTAFVKSFITTYLIPLADTISITAGIFTFNDVRLNVLKGNVATLNIQGGTNLGQSTTTITAFDSGSGGITFPMDTDYPYILSSLNTNSQRIQAGYITISGVTFSPVNTPILPAGTSNALATPNINMTAGTQAINPAFGFNIRPGTTTSAEFNWIMFQTNA